MSHGVWISFIAKKFQLQLIQLQTLDHFSSDTRTFPISVTCVSRMLKWSDTAELGIYQPSQLSSTNMGLHVNDLLYMHLKCWMKKPVKTYTNPTLQLQPLLQIPTKQVLIGSASINVAAEALPPSLDQLPAIITSHLPGPC